MKDKIINFMVVIIMSSGSFLIAQHSSYLSEVNNEIKALTEQEVNHLVTGAGMGLAKAAELNHYPGPKHVLELAFELELTEKQKTETESVYDIMKIDAVETGKRIVEKEKELQQLFEQARVNENLLHEKIMQIAELKGKLRFIHLNAHIKQKGILTEEQTKKYDKLRGY